MKDHERIIFILAGAGPTSISTVAKALRISGERTFRAMCELRADGKVVHLGPSRWGLTELGSRVADDGLKRQMWMFPVGAEA